MKINLKSVGEFLGKRQLWDKSFRDFNKKEMLELAMVICEAADSEGWTPPHINKDGNLVVPTTAPLKYRWWVGGQSVLDTLKELGASEEIIKSYTPTGYGEGMRKPC